MQRFIKRKGDVKITVAGVLRPGCTSLSDDPLHLDEIEYFHKQGLLKNHILECGGHIKFEHFKEFAEVIGEAKVSLMGPLITEATNKYDHITNMTGQTLMATFCKSIAGLLVLTPAEHLHLPNLKEDKEAITHAKICQHYIGLIYKDKPSLELEKTFRKRPYSCNSQMNLFGKIKGDKVCNMCGNFIH